MTTPYPEEPEDEALTSADESTDDVPVIIDGGEPPTQRDGEQDPEGTA